MAKRMDIDDMFSDNCQRFQDCFCLAAENIRKDIGGFDGLNTKDEKRVFNLIYEIVRPQVDLSPEHFARYCKIGRYSLIYHVSWAIASVNTRQQLRELSALAHVDEPDLQKRKQKLLADRRGATAHGTT